MTQLHQLVIADALPVALCLVKDVLNRVLSATSFESQVAKSIPDGDGENTSVTGVAGGLVVLRRRDQADFVAATPIVGVDIDNATGVAAIGDAQDLRLRVEVILWSTSPSHCVPPSSTKENSSNAHWSIICRIVHTTLKPEEKASACTLIGLIHCKSCRNLC